MDKTVINFMPKSKLAPSAGCLLISEPFLSDPDFKRSVILLCEHDTKSSFGFVLNKHVEVSIQELIENFPDFETKVSMGGPVEQNNLFYLHTRGDVLRNSRVLCNNLCIGGNFQELKSAIENEQISEQEVRFFIGYSGWSEGQLEQELAENSWIVAPANIEKVMQNQSEELWKESLKALGQEFAILANFPEDPSLN